MFKDIGGFSVEGGKKQSRGFRGEMRVSSVLPPCPASSPRTRRGGSVPAAPAVPPPPQQGLPSTSWLPQWLNTDK